MKKLLLVLILLGLFSCQKLRYGNITEMRYEPKESYFMLIPYHMQTGKTSTTLLIPFWIIDNEDWVITVKGIGTKGDTITRSLYVDKSCYDTLSVGKFICIDGMCGEDKNNTKEKKK